jgi:hypothetical protein
MARSWRYRCLAQVARSRCRRATGRDLYGKDIWQYCTEYAEAGAAFNRAMVAPGGRERTRDEFAGLLAQADFELTRVVPAGRSNVIEARPI